MTTMTNIELADTLNYKLFDDCGTDLQAAIKRAYEYINAIQPSERIAASCALHIVLNTVSNIIKENENENS
jgi:hypothetical protein